jgi:hypothetical protein
MQDYHQEYEMQNIVAIDSLAPGLFQDGNFDHLRVKDGQMAAIQVFGNGCYHDGLYFA